MQINCKLIIAGIFLLLSVSCSVDTNVTLSSGTTNDPFIEEPLISQALKYENALVSSNQIVDKLIALEYDDLYKEHISERLKRSMSMEEFESSINTLTDHFGELSGNKPLQWSFKTSRFENTKIVTSKKYVDHPNGKLQIELVYIQGSDYQKIEGFKINPL